MSEVQQLEDAENSSRNTDKCIEISIYSILIFGGSIFMYKAEYG